MQKNILFIIIFKLFFFVDIYANFENLNDKVVLSGYIKDSSNGELLIGANIYFKELKTGTISNLYGFYSFSVDPGVYQVNFVYMGYKTISKRLEITQDIDLDIELEEETENIEEVVVLSKKLDANVRDPQMSVQKLQSKDVKAVPALMGEVDVIKVLQLMPGVQATSEGASGFSVRGGNPDQNLVLLDEAIVYNAGHMLGFFSVFNNDAIKDVKLYKGDIPASSGGRLSSLVDVRMNDGNNKKIEGKGGIGLISSRLTLEGPIIKDKTSFIISGRRTYADIFLPLVSDEEAQDSRLHFYDLNVKIKHVINNHNRLYFSTYMGRDVFKDVNSQIDYGNQTFTLRWNHVYNPKLFSNLTFVGSKYDYELGTSEETSVFTWESRLRDFSLKLDYNYYLNPNNTISFGFQSISHKINPGTAQGKGEDSMFSKVEVPDSRGLEHGIYVSNNQKIGARLNIKYGLRFSGLQNIGEGTVYEFDNSYEAINQLNYKSGDIFNSYWGWEPRIGMSYILNSTTSIKSSYSKTRQYIHLASNSTSTTPLDVWFMSSPNVKPQICDQFSAGLFKNFSDHTIESSIELFYKDMKNTIDFKDHPDLLLNDKMEGEIRTGKSWAYGAEFLLKFNLEKFNGWVGYTWSKSWRKIPEVNKGLKYLSPYSHDHDISFVLNHKINNRCQVGLNWVYFTGSPFTAPNGRIFVGGDIVPIYSARNEERMPDYHRMDVSFTIKNKKKEGRRWEGEWNFSVYNLYGRKNAWSIFFEQDDKDPYKATAQKTYLFKFVPSVTYNFKF